MPEESFDVIVIGAGFGGSSCAGLLAKKGLNVCLVEKNKVAGGKAMSISKKGHTYTPWVVIGAPVEGNAYQRVLDELDVADLATLAIPETSGSIYKTPEGKYVRMPAMVNGQFDPSLMFQWLGIPQEKQGDALNFFAQMVTMAPDKVKELDGTDFESWIRSFGIPDSLYGFLVSLCCDGMFMVAVDKLDAAEAIGSLQQMFLRGGGIFAEGGFGTVAEAYCEAVRRNGGTVHMGTRTEKILIEEGKVTGVQTKKGTFKAPVVISNAGIQPTVLNMVDEEHWDADYVKYVKELEPSYSLLGYRYFLSKPITDAGFGVIFSDTSPWTQERLDLAHQGKASREGVVYYEVPANYDPNAAPEGKQMIMTGSFCPADPDMSKEDIHAWADAGEKIVFEAFPDLEACIESKDMYTTKSVSNATRDATVPGAGGETIGLAQKVGQCGATKPDIAAPIEGLYFVGADAGAEGVGTQMAILSGIKVSDTVYEKLKG